MGAQRVALAVEPSFEIGDRALAARDPGARELEREARLPDPVFLDLELEAGGADTLAEGAAADARRVELALEPRDLAAQLDELGLAAARSCAAEREPENEDRRGATGAAQNESTASSSESITSKTVTSWVIWRMSLTFGGRPTSLRRPPRLVTVV